MPPSASLNGVTQSNTAVQLLEQAAADGTVPGGVLLSGSSATAGTPVPFGRLTPGGEPVSAETRYDLASLTKVVATLPSILQLISAGEVEPDKPLRHWFSNAGWFQAPSLGDATVRQLLSHSSGLPAWVPLFTRTRARLLALGTILQAEVRPAAGTDVYSDLGFMLLGALVERVSGQRLGRFAQEHIFGPLGMTATGFRAFADDGRPEPAPPGTFAPTEYCGWRNRLLTGEVHDENCCAWEGVAGHAGLFGTAGDLGRYAQAWLNLDARLGDPALLKETQEEHARTAGGEPRGLGWLLAHANSFSGLPGYGHTGFTGTSLWLDPERDRFTVLLTNRVHPDRHRTPSLTELRRAVHAAAAERSTT